MGRLIAGDVPAPRAATLVREQGQRDVSPKPPEEIVGELVDALVDLDAARAGRLLSEAFSLHVLEKVLLDIITPAMVRVGELWHAGEILVTTEHFATNFVQGRLRALLALVPGHVSWRKAIVTCAPTERHELGSLILAVLLRRAGIDAIYLGADTPVADLLEMARSHRLEVVFLSASRPEAVAELRLHGAQLRSMEALLIVGGRAFVEFPDLADERSTVLR